MYPVWHSISCACGRCLHADKEYIGPYVEPLPDPRFYPLFVIEEAA